MNKLRLWHSPKRTFLEWLQVVIDDACSHLHDKPLLGITLVFAGFYLVVLVPMFLIASHHLVYGQFPWTGLAIMSIPWFAAALTYWIFLENVAYFIEPLCDRITDWIDRQFSCF